MIKLINWSRQDEKTSKNIKKPQTTERDKSFTAFTSPHLFTSFILVVLLYLYKLDTHALPQYVD